MEENYNPPTFDINWVIDHLPLLLIKCNKEGLGYLANVDVFGRVIGDNGLYRCLTREELNTLTDRGVLFTKE